MKNVILHSILTTTALFATMGYMNTASAHTATGILNAAASSVDVYQTTCSKNAAGSTGQFVTHVKAAKGTPLVSIQAYKGKFATNSTDTKNGDTIFSPDVMIKGGGEGVYTILVDKNGAGKINYTLEAHCETLKGAHTGQKAPVLYQNQ